ncbi:AzlC family ABC transporter permease [Lysinibacillus telephonicus]|uniref:Branched-chain amino acid ABC transporter permease n=1 Tax=Lysinibacillus telephonicus TaxID=1714840 RepID=A0A431UJX3_9BACI|nr:AzlC family ABC transporter permease [Lysinibacillus telephonicus]RTQ90040.1 branched-chain amino acid ABC transporter permease [Lysinibacillus telephonicus]
MNTQVNVNHSLTLDTFSQGIKDCIPTLLGYISIGLAFGVIGITSNLSILEIFLLSVIVYAGSAQFIFCGLYVAGAPFSVIIITTFIVNLRHFLMSLTVAPHFTRYSPLRNIGFGTLLTDETFGVAVTKLTKEKHLGGNWMDGLNLTAYITWIASCTLGGIVGKWLPNAESLGLDFALISMFGALLVLNLVDLSKSKLMHYIKLIVLMAIIMYCLLYFLPGHLAVLIATVIVATIGVVTEK